MRLNGGVDQELIQTCLNTIEKLANENNVSYEDIVQFIYQAFYEISKGHEEILSDADSFLELAIEYFLKPLKSALLGSFGLAAMLTVFQVGKYELKILSKNQANKLIPAALRERDSRLSIFSDWLIVVRLDKERKFLT